MSRSVSLTFRMFQNGKLVREDRLSQSVIKIGKVSSAHLCVDDDTVSRMHAIIEVSGANDISIIDLGSTRGTFVNGARINKAKLQAGDVIEVGATRLELAIESVAASVPTIVVAPPTPAPVVRIAPPPVPAPIMAAPAPVASAPVARPIVTAIEADGEDYVAARSVEVAAMLGDSVVDVKHCLDPHSGKVTRTTWAFLAAGVASLVVSSVAFAVSVNNASNNQAARDHWVADGKPVAMFKSDHLSVGWDWLAFGGLAMGITGVAASLARVRSEKRSPYYRIGTAPGVEMPVESAPLASFPLVAPKGDDFVFNYGAGIDGELIADGSVTPLAELAAAGRAHPSSSMPGAFELAIPAKAKIRARAGGTTFMVSSVARPRRYVAPLLAGIETRGLVYLGGSAVAHLGLLALLSTMPIDDGSISPDLASTEMTLTRAAIAAQEAPAPPPPEQTNDGGDGQGEPRPGMALENDPGAAGTPKSQNQDGGMQITKRDDNQPRLSRAEAIENARNSGFLGEAAELTQGIHSITSTMLSDNGMNETSVWGPIYGAAGEANGKFGFSRSGDGLGGGCRMPPCGIIGTGGYNTIGQIPGYGPGGWGPGLGHHVGRNHVAQVPPVSIGQPIVGDGIDKAIIRRYMKRHEPQLSYCYEKELLAHPELGGEMIVQFMIGSDGAVQGATGRGFNATVTNCVAGVVGSIKFPRPNGPVQVNYPFTFTHK